LIEDLAPLIQKLIIDENERSPSPPPDLNKIKYIKTADTDKSVQ